MKWVRQLIYRYWSKPTLARWVTWRIAWWLRMHARAIWHGIVGLLIVVEAWAIGGLLRAISAPPELVGLLLWVVLCALVWMAATGEGE